MRSIVSLKHTATKVPNKNEALLAKRSVRRLHPAFAASIQPNAASIVLGRPKYRLRPVVSRLIAPHGGFADRRDQDPVVAVEVLELGDEGADAGGVEEGDVVA